MPRLRLAARAVASFLVLPGVLAILVPLALGAADPWRGPTYWVGLAPAFAGLTCVWWCVVDFARRGKGTLAPWDPPRTLVESGLYRHVRNPMYVGGLLLVAGFSSLFASPILAAYVGCLAVGFHVRVVRCEEPRLEAQFPREWVEYASHVRRWVPRIKPWPPA